MSHQFELNADDHAEIEAFSESVQERGRVDDRSEEHVQTQERAQKLFDRMQAHRFSLQQQREPAGREKAARPGTSDGRNRHQQPIDDRQFVAATEADDFTMIEPMDSMMDTSKPVPRLKITMKDLSLDSPSSRSPSPTKASSSSTPIKGTAQQRRYEAMRLVELPNTNGKLAPSIFAFKVYCPELNPPDRDFSSLPAAVQERILADYQFWDVDRSVRDFKCISENKNNLSLRIYVGTMVIVKPKGLVRKIMPHKGERYACETCKDNRRACIIMRLLKDPQELAMLPIFPAIA